MRNIVILIVRLDTENLLMELENYSKKWRKTQKRRGEGEII